MEHMTFEFELTPPFKNDPKNYSKTRSVSGVVGSGNLEVIIEMNNNPEKAHFEIDTSVANYQKIWGLVIQDFVTEYQPAGLKFIIHDNGAIPPVVSLRLKQAFELFSGYQKPLNNANANASSNYLELTGRQRISALVDPKSFKEWLADETFYSPHLTALNLPCEDDDGVVIGSATFNGKNILIASQEKDFMGGAVGEIHGAKLTGLFKAAVKNNALKDSSANPIEAIILLIDSGGVRLHEANAGEIAISEIIRAVFEARNQGIITIGVICGKNGAFGGVGILSGCLDYLMISEMGRIGVSGPEVIQAVKGIEAFDSQDRGLIWRVYGGKTRYLQQVVQEYVDSSLSDISKTITKIIVAHEQKPNVINTAINVDYLKRRQILLESRLTAAGDCKEEGEFLNKNNITSAIFDMNTADFLAIADKIRNENSGENGGLITHNTVAAKNLSPTTVALETVLKSAFTEHTINTKNEVIFGTGIIQANNTNTQFHIIGVEENTFLGVEQALVISEKLIEIIESKSTSPILLLVDVAGQKLSMQDEWLSMTQCFGHVLTCLSLLREQNNQLISLIYNQAIGGGFIAYGLMADTILALPNAQVAVMWLEGMSKVTKIPLETLQELSKTSPVFAPGIENFKKLGGIHDIVALPDLQKVLLNEINKKDTNNKNDCRAKLGYDRGGRKLAYPVIEKCIGIN